jgi:hypothetical protein
LSLDGLLHVFVKDAEEHYGFKIKVFVLVRQSILFVSN